MSNARAVNALLIEMSMLPIQAPSLRTWPTRFSAAVNYGDIHGLGRLHRLGFRRRNDLRGFLHSYHDMLYVSGRLGQLLMRIDDELVGGAGVEVLVAFGRLVELDQRWAACSRGSTA